MPDNYLITVQENDKNTVPARSIRTSVLLDEEIIPRGVLVNLQNETVVLITQEFIEWYADIFKLNPK